MVFLKWARCRNMRRAARQDSTRLLIGSRIDSTATGCAIESLAGR